MNQFSSLIAYLSFDLKLASALRELLLHVSYPLNCNEAPVILDRPRFCCRGK